MRLLKHKNIEADNYICPIHGNSLILRQKNSFNGALDQFFLSCSFWNGDKPGSCNYKVKIKSPAQLAAVLKTFEGRGIL